MNDEEFKSWVEKTGFNIDPGGAAAATKSFSRFVDLARREQSEMRRLLKGQ